MSKKVVFSSEPVVLITGGNNGIGFFMAKNLIEQGYKVAVLDLSGENLKNLDGDKLMFLKCDVTEEETVNSLVKSVAERWGGIDILVNNACIAVNARFAERDSKETRREFEVNYFGYVNTIKAVLPYMKSKGNGIIHNMSSGVGLTGFPGICGYASTKGAVEALSKTLDIELEGDGIRVNVMHPPLTRTKSAVEIGIPQEVMADPKKIGERLSKKIKSVKPCVTADVSTSFFLFMTKRFPTAVGRLLAKLTERSKSSK